MKLKAISRVVAMFLVNNIFAGAYLFEVKRKLLNKLGFSLGEGTKVVGPIYCSATLKTGSNCWFGKNVTIHGNGTVVLGDNCDIAKNVTFLTGVHATDPQEPDTEESLKPSIFLGDGCWIGADATLGRNITIGKGSMVLADSCVLKSMPENTLIGGVPARIVRKLDEV